MESLFEVLTNKTYIKPEEPKPDVVPDTTDSLPEFPVVPLPADENQQPTAGTPVEDELQINDEVLVVVDSIIITKVFLSEDNQLKTLILLCVCC